ncbi:hypothetical protein IFVP195_C1120041 [Vibrio parahaemolyticus]
MLLKNPITYFSVGNLHYKKAQISTPLIRPQTIIAIIILGLSVSVARANKKKSPKTNK